MSEPSDDSIDERIAAKLRARRPEPSRQFAGRLRERMSALQLRSRRPARLWLLAGGLIAAGVLLLVIAATAIAAPPSTFTTGFVEGGYADQATENLWLGRTVGTGARVVLVGVDWASIAPAPPARGTDPSDPANPGYNWGTLDQTVQAATAHGLTVAFTVAGAAGGPAWADGPGRPRAAAPGTWRPNAQALGAFARAVARRYSGTFNPGTGTLPWVRYYQAWSEPNLPNHLSPQWVRVHGRWVAESPVIYRGLLNAFYAGVKAVDRADLVITGGTAPFGDKPGGQRVPPVVFVRGLLCLGGEQLNLQPCPDPAHFDILAHHPYEIGAPTQPAGVLDDVSVPDFYKLTRPLALAERTGRVLPRGHKRLWVTEFSYDSNPPNPHGVPVRELADWTEETFYLLWRQGVDTITWFLIVDQPPIPNYGSTYQSGVYYLNGKPKPSFEAFRFPFVVEPSRPGRAVLWGIAPDSGTVDVQRLQSGRWITVTTFRRGARAIFTRTIALGGRPLMRAVVGGEISLEWRAP